MKAQASPAKRFFVEMLTRDIELADAILDLLDNCVDGALRSGGADLLKPYSGYHAHITLSPTAFVIEDNCGGITRDLAEKYAFRFGRPDSDRDAGLATVGVYGIGMKRAIFKLGTDCVIESRHGAEAFSVHIDQDWIDKDDEWQLDMADQAPSLQFPGTRIKIGALHKSAGIEFDNEKSSFVGDFGGLVQKHYSYIIEKGFSIRVNNVLVQPSMIQTLFDTTAFDEGPASAKSKAITPYIYTTTWEDVEVTLVMGLYQKLPTEEEETESMEGRRNKESAGWTVICNDRVVVSADKSRLTGWGEAGVPAYHSQFIALAGVVSFRSNDAQKLPVTTTKRGLDQNSELFGHVKDEMRSALKHFTSFTNHWKSQTEERQAVQLNTETVDIRLAVARVPQANWTPIRKGIQGRKYVPTLPRPEQEEKYRRVQFTKPIAEIAVVGEYLLENSQASPADVGIAAFDWIHKRAAKK